MDAVVVAAIVAGVVSILVATGKAGWDARQRKQERGVATRAKLDRYREPLLGAVDELGNRIDNIRNKRFFVYLGTDRRNLALRSTLFRIGEYFAWVEILYGTSGQYRFTLDEKTKEVASKIRLAGATFASDKHDQVVPTDFRTTRLMLWREEQRAIGEVMRIRGRDPGCIGFDAFDQQYCQRFADRFKRFSDELESIFRSTGEDAAAPDSVRFRLLHGILAQLLVELDIDRVVVKLDDAKKVLEPKWARRAPQL